ncbi:MAG: autotransporter domain-containing protein [Thermodesulfobacteriota bacterium]|nr:autotransporter domain-containing protein [Thermodesulfobacteriota bacterium]
MEARSIILQNAGVSIISHLDAVEGIELNDGTLQVNSDLQLTDKGYLQTKINNNGISGQFLVMGELGLAGKMDVIAAPYAYRNGETFDVISALDIVDKFDTVNLPASTPLLRFETLQFSDLWQIEVTTKNFTTVATNPVEKAIANSLDTILPTSSGDLSNVLGSFQLLSKPDDFTTAFSSLSPDSYDNATRITFEVTQQYTKTVQHRMNAIRANLYTTGKDTQAKASSTRSPLLLSYKDSNADIGDLLGRKQQVQLEKTYGFWLDGFGFLGDQDKEDSFTGFDYQLFGTALGFDHVLTDRMIAGVSVGDTYTDIDLDTNEGDGTIHSIGISVYGTYFTDRAFIEGLMSYTKQHYANDRNIIIGSIRRTAISDHDGNAFSAILSGGYNFHVNNWTMGPFSSLQYIYLDEESFKESGAGSINLKVDDRQTEFLASELGLRIAREFKTDNGNLIPEISAAWSHDFDVGDRAITASFTSSPDALFTIEGLVLKEMVPHLELVLRLLTKAVSRLH